MAPYSPPRQPSVPWRDEQKKRWSTANSRHVPQHQTASAYSASNAPYCQPVGNDRHDSTANAVTKPLSMRLAHLPDLPMADTCRQTLERIWKEFEPIVRRRGYNVKSISEFCCCGDGLDHHPETRRQRKRRKQSNNVLGYNQTTFQSRRQVDALTRQTIQTKQTSKSHTIHLRLRNPQRHNTQLLSWEDVAGTMAHELSHCVHQNHSPAFYKLMEEILDEHAQIQLESMGGLIYGHTTQPTVNNDTTTMPTVGGQRLGGREQDQNRLLGPSTPASAVGGNVSGMGHVLGGNGSARLTPQARREAMAAAAEQRRRRMQRLQRMIERSKEPCIIEIDQEEEDDPFEDQNQAPPTRESTDRTKRKVPPQAASSNAEPSIVIPENEPEPLLKRAAAVDETIDLTHTPTASAAKHKKSRAAPQSVPPPESSPCWDCPSCTFQNRPLALQCDICHAVRPTILAPAAPKDQVVIELLD